MAVFHCRDNTWGPPVTLIMTQVVPLHHYMALGLDRRLPIPRRIIFHQICHPCQHLQPCQTTRLRLMGLATTLTIQAHGSPKQGRRSHTTTVHTLLALSLVITRRNDLLVRLDAWTLSFVTILYQNILPAHQVDKWLQGTQTHPRTSPFF
jgi:hypothetical protein